MKKRCTKCHRWKGLKHYSKRGNSRCGVRAQCRKCCAAAPYGYLNKRWSIFSRYCKARKDAKRRGISWGLSLVEFEIFDTLPCLYCGRHTETKTGTKLDRIDNDKAKGYVTGNLVPCCRRCNVLRSDKFTFSEMLIISEALKKIETLRQDNCPLDTN